LKFSERHSDEFFDGTGGLPKMMYWPTRCIRPKPTFARIRPVSVREDRISTVGLAVSRQAEKVAGAVEVTMRIPALSRVVTRASCVTPMRAMHPQCTAISAAPRIQGVIGASRK
jgi:hypothetical protein